MSYSKRKWEDIEDFDEEEPAYGKQILPVANLPLDFNEEPMDGMQYLFMVRRDARQLPSTIRAPNPYEKPEPTPIAKDNSDPLSSPNHSRLPSEEWRQAFERRFQNFRKNFKQPTTYVGPMDPPQSRLIPDKKDRDLWWSFLAGRPDSEWNLSKKFKQKLKKQQSASRGTYARGDEPSAENTTATSVTQFWNNDEGEVEEVLRIDPAETLPSPVGTPVPLEYLEAISQPSSIPIPSNPALFEEERLTPREPTPQLLKLIDERVALHLLMYFTHWINFHLNPLESSAYAPTESHGRWIFCLLSRIDDFISPDDMNLLRNLARACISLLKHIKQQDSKAIGALSSEVSTSKVMSESSCWVVIAIVAGVWKQRDLWTDAEDALRLI